MRRAGAVRQVVVTDRAASFGDRLRMLVQDERPRRGLIILSSGAVPLLRDADALRLVAGAREGSRSVLTNNRFSSDICAIGDATAIRHLPALASDNVLPHWLVESAGYSVMELPGRERLAIDLDSPLDLALAARSPSLPRRLRRLAAGIDIPRGAQLREVAADPRAQLLVLGRSGSRALRWLERHTRCRVRFISEERGLRSGVDVNQAPPRSVLGRLLQATGPGSLASHIAELADGALIDTRVLLADRLGAHESAWPVPEDRFASDLLLPEAIADPWLRELTSAAATSDVPIQLGAHTLVGPGLRLLLAGSGARAAR